MRFSIARLLSSKLAAQLALLLPRRLLAVPIGDRLLHRRPAGVVFLDHGALARHALLALEGSDGAPLGSAVLALPDAGAATVAAPLTLGGRAVGALAAVVTVSAP